MSCVARKPVFLAAQLICIFVFTHANSRFSHDASQIKEGNVEIVLMFNIQSLFEMYSKPCHSHSTNLTPDLCNYWF